MGGGPVSNVGPQAPLGKPAVVDLDAASASAAAPAEAAAPAFAMAPGNLPAMPAANGNLRYLKPTQNESAKPKDKGVELRAELETSFVSVAALSDLSQTLQALGHESDDAVRGFDLLHLQNTWRLLLNRAEAHERWEAHERRDQAGIRYALQAEIREIRGHKPTAFNKPETVRVLAEIADRLVAREKILTSLAMKKMIGELSALPTSDDHFQGVKAAFKDLDKADFPALKAEFDRSVVLTVLDARSKMFEIQGRSVGWYNLMMQGLVSAGGSDKVAMMTPEQTETAKLDESGFAAAAGDYRALFNQIKADPKNIPAVLVEFGKLEAKDRAEMRKNVGMAERFNQWTLGVGMLIGAMLAAEGVGLLIAPWAAETGYASLILYGVNGVSFHTANTVIANTVMGTWDVYGAAWSKNPNGAANEFLVQSSLAAGLSFQAGQGKELGVWAYRQIAARGAAKETSQAMALYEQGLARTPQGRTPRAVPFGETVAGFVGETYVGLHLYEVAQEMWAVPPEAWLKTALHAVDPRDVGASFAMGALTKLGMPLSSLMQKAAMNRQYGRLLMEIEQSSVDLRGELGATFAARNEEGFKDKFRQMLGDYETLLLTKREALKAMAEEAPDAAIRDLAFENDRALRDLRLLPEFVTWMSAFTYAGNPHGVRAGEGGRMVYAEGQALGIAAELSGLPWVKSAHVDREGVITVGFDAAFFQGEVRFFPAPSEARGRLGARN